MVTPVSKVTRYVIPVVVVEGDIATFVFDICWEFLWKTHNDVTVRKRLAMWNKKDRVLFQRTK
jgi:hypothetical protein